MSFRRCLYLVYLLVAVVSTGVSGASVDSLHLYDDVELLDLSRAEAKGSVGAATPLADADNISVMTLDGNYDRGNPQPRFDVASAFIESHADTFDFLVVFTSFEFPTGEALAFYNPVFNDVQGIGIAPFDHRAEYGGSARLQGYIDMAAMSRYEFNSRSPEYRSPLDTLTHEIMHRWSVQLRYADAVGQLSDDLIGRGGVHWSLAASTDASLMYGARWSESAPGTWTIAESRRRLGAWDLYLAGLMAESELSPLGLIRAAAIDPDALPDVGLEVQGAQELVSVAQVIAAEGAREPAAGVAQTQFNAAIVLLLRPGEVADPADLARLERFRVAFEQYFQAITRGRASIRLHLTPSAHDAIAAPPPLQGSTPAPHAQPVDAAAQWLVARQASAGHWQDRSATATRDTVAAAEFLADAGSHVTALAAAHAWLQVRQPANVDEAAWIQRGDPASMPADVTTPNADGGSGMLAHWHSSPMDSAQTLSGHDASLQQDQSAIAALGQYLVVQQNPDGGFGPTSGGRGTVPLSTLAAAQLLRRQSAVERSAGARARDWLQGIVDAVAIGSGGFALSDVAELSLNAGALQLPPATRIALTEYLLARQGQDGDWGGSVYTTSVAGLALLRELRPNLVAVSVSVSPASPVQGEWVRLRARIANRGGQVADASMLRWYDADPQQTPGPDIGNVPLPALLPGEEISLDTWIETTAPSGARVLYAWADADAALAEGREDDNIAQASLEVGDPPSLPDLSLHVRDLQFQPAAITLVPSTALLSGRIRNLGSTPSTAVVLRAFDADPDGPNTMLAATTIDVGPTASSVFSLDLPIVAARAYRVRVVADPDHVVIEAREDNNQAEVTIPLGGAVDFELLGPTLELTPAEPVLGDDLRVRIAIANRGATDSPASVLSLELESGGDWEQVAQVALSIAAGAQVTRDVSWRPSRDGETSLRLRVDPDALVAETDEDNNVLAFVLQVGQGTQSNLVVLPGSISVLPDPVLQGVPLRVGVTLRNVGSTDAAPFNVALYRGDPRSGGVRLGASRVEAGLAALADVGVDIDVSEYVGHGDAELFVYADSELEIDERNETDNVGIRTITSLSMQDLAVTLASIQLTPSAPVLGQPVIAQVSISNLGEQPSQSALVRLSERANDVQAPIDAGLAVPALPPGGSFVAEWSWTFGLIEDTRALSIQIDPDNLLREGNELNNEITLLLDTQSGDAFATEVHFSPNGDGVKDQTRIVWRDAAQIDSVVITDHAGRERRHFASVEDAGNGAASVSWDGRDDTGRVLADGRYAVATRSSGAGAQAPVYVTLDTDQPMALEAANSENGIYRELPPSVHAWQFAPDGTPAEDFAYVVGDAANDLSLMHRGLVRSNVLLGGIEPVLTAPWLDRYAQANGLVALEVAQVTLLDNGRVLLAAHEWGGDHRTLLFGMAAGEIDTPTLLAAVDTRALEPLLGRFDPRRVLVGDRAAGEPRWIVDLDNSAVTPLRADASTGEVVLVNASGVVVRTDNADVLQFVPIDPANELVSHQIVQGRGARHAFSDDGMHYLLHYQYYDTETVFVVDVVSGEMRELVSAPVPVYDSSGEGRGVGKRDADERADAGRIRVLRAFWLEHQREIMVLDHGAARLHRFDYHGAELERTDLPAVQRTGEYSAELQGNPLAVYGVHLGEVADRYVDCIDSAHQDWLSQADSRLGFERQSFDPDSGSVYLTSGELVEVEANQDNQSRRPQSEKIYYDHPVTCEGAVDYLRIGRHGNSERLGGSTVWPLASSLDQSVYPTLQQMDGIAIAPPDWPTFIHRNGSLLQRDGRVWIPSQGRFTSSWAYASRVRDSNRAQTRLHLAAESAQRSEQRTAALYSTLEKLTAHLNASSDGRTVTLAGVAADRNFDHFRIDWAFASSPDAWNALVPATRNQIRFDDFIGWAPPLPGAYLFRLRVVDRAGNTREGFASADVEVGSPIVDLRQDHRYISPNGDAVQDALTLTFNVSRASEQRFDVRDSAGRVVRSEDRIYGTPELGPNSWIWDGRNDAGVLVAEGRYRVELSSGHVLPVFVDVTAPVVTADLTLPWSQFGASELRQFGPESGRGPLVRYLITDAIDGAPGALQLQRLESSLLDRAEWIELQPYRSFVTDTGMVTAALASPQYVARRFRVVAVDAAGNRTEAAAGSSQPALLLVHADRLRENMPAFQSLPHGGMQDIPTYQVPDPSVVQPIDMPVQVGVEVPLFALDLKGDADELLVDELVTANPGAPPAWVTRAVMPPQAPQQIVPGFIDGSVARATIDLSVRDPGSYATLRMRARYPDGSELVSNATRFLMGGVTLECPPGFSARFIATSYLEEPATDFTLEMADAGFTVQARIRETQARQGNQLWFTPPQQAYAWYRAAATDALGRRISSRWIACNVPPPAGGGAAAVSVTASPVFAALCDETPTGLLRISSTGLEASRLYRVIVRSPLLASAYQRAVSAGAGESFELDVSSWPAADYRVQLEARLDEQQPWQELAQGSFAVDHTAPQVNLIAPANGARYCANAPIQPELVVSVQDQQSFGFLLENRPSGSSQSFAPLKPPECYGLIGPANPNCPTIETGQITRFSSTGRVDHASRLQTPGVLNTAETRVRATDWSGAQVCRSVQHSIDASAQLEERSSPLPLSPSNTVRFPAIAPGSSGQYQQARWFLRARETLNLDVLLYAATAIPAQPGAVAVGEPIATLATLPQVSGDPDFAWDGMLAGAPLADGLYVIRFRATDDCGNQAQLDRPVLLDATPPTVQLLHPLPGAQLRVATLQVSGIAHDPQLDRHQVELSQSSAQGPWQVLADSDRPVTQPALLAQWTTQGAQGPLWIRLSASDWLGNRAETVHAAELLPRELVLQDARVAPALFSPNDDARLDATSIVLDLRLDALVDVRVLDSLGAEIRSLRSNAAMPARRTLIAWDGRRHDGVVVPDGSYRIEVRAADASLPASIDEQVLQVEVDTVAPLISAVEPHSDVVSCDEAASFVLDEPALDRFSARLLRDATTVALRTGRAEGVHVVKAFEGLAEANYRFEIEADDLAGNRSEQAHEFVLDCTAPTALISAPLAEAVVPRAAGMPVPVDGTALDPHLDSYVVDIAPATSPQLRTMLVQASAPATDARLLDWQPEQADGDYLLRLQVRDRAGNESDSVHPVRVDGTPPLAQIDYPQPGQLVQQHLHVHGSASDDNFAHYRIEFATPAQAAAGQWSGIFDANQARISTTLADLSLAQEGELVIRLVVTDLAGLSSSSDVQITVDAQPPPAPLDLTGVLEDRRNVRLAWQGADVPDLAGFRILRNGREMAASPTRSHLDVDVPEGELRYQVVALDHAGNASAPSNTVTLRVDRSPPAVAIFAPASQERLRGVYPISGLAFSDSDFGEYRLELLATDGNVLEQLRRSTSAVSGGVLHAWDTRGIVSESSLRLRLTALDTSGNEAQVDVPVVVDNEPPSAPTGLVVLDVGTDVQLNWDPNLESDLLGYLLYRGGQLLGASGSLPADLRPLAQPQNARTDADAPDGELSYRVYAIDRAGNLSTPSLPALLTRDAGPPHLQIVRPQSGEAFSDAIEVLAQSADRDIANVVFAYRAVGEPTWSTFGDVVTGLPWRATFEPSGLAHGEFELRAVATDAGSLVDPSPPSVVVRFADVTPPPSPTTLIARADGDSVSISWQPSVAEDLAGYRVERQAQTGQWLSLQAAPIVGTSITDSDRAPGVHSYRVIALDLSDNASAPSSADSAHVFTLLLQQPFTPTSQATVTLAGRSAERGGAVQYRIVGEADTVQGDAQTVAAHSDFVLDPLALPSGRNVIELRILDAEGNRSLAATAVLRRGEVPLPPSDLAGSIDNLDVTLDWQPSPSDDVAGYRVYRNDRAIATDSRVMQPLNASAPNGNAAVVVDGSLATAWSIAAPADSAELGHSATLELNWPTPELIGGVRVRFDSSAASANEYRVSALDPEAGWIPLASRVNRSSADELLLLDSAYPTRALRIQFIRAQAPGNVLRVLEVEPLQRTLVVATTTVDHVDQGRHQYAVSAVSALGLESQRSAPWLVEIGDVDPPPTVLLSGAVVNGDPVVNWTESVAADLAGYVLYRDAQPIAEIAAAAPRTWTDSGVANGDYVYTVTAQDLHFNQSPPSNPVALQVASEAPGQPDILSVTQPDASFALRVEWAAGAGPAPSLYHLEVGAAAAGPYTRLLSLDATGYLHRGLIPGQRYFYRVQAEDAHGNLSAPSTPASALVVDTLPPLTPSLTYPAVPGVRTVLSLPGFDVCGITSPAATVIVAREGVAIGQAVARDRWTQRNIDGAADYSEAALSGDGRSVLLSHAAAADRPGWFDLQTGQRVRGTGQYFATLHLLRTLGSSNRVLATNDSGAFAMLGRDEPEHEIYERFYFGPGLRDFATDRDARRVVALGPYDGQGDGLWIARQTFQNFEAVPLPAGRNVREGSLRWSGSHDSVLFADEQGRVYRLDPGTLLVTELSVPLIQRGPYPAPHGNAWLALDASSRVLRFDVDGQAPVVLLDDGRQPRAVAWSPDARLLALRYLDTLEVRDASTGNVLDSVAAAQLDPDAVHELRWSAAWQLLLRSDDGRTPELTEVAGSFCARDLLASPGLQFVQAVAEGSNGLLSLPSGMLEIELEQQADAEVDLRVQPTDLRLFPEGARIGDQLVAYITLQNRGYDWAVLPPERMLTAQLQRPDGSVQLTTIASSGEIEPGGSLTLAVDLGRATVIGDYTLAVEADPDALLNETDESNNRASRTWSIDVVARPQLALSSERSFHVPGEIVRGQVEVANPGAPFQGDVVVHVLDPDGAAAQQVAQFALPALGTGQLRQFDWSWTPAALASGAHTVRATLRSVSGASLQVRTTTVVIEARADLSLLLQPALASPIAGTALPIQIGIDYVGGNRLLETGLLRVLALADDGSEQLLWQGSTGLLLPGYSVRRTVVWPGSLQAPGNYTLRLTFSSGDVQLVRDSLLRLRSPDGSDALLGTLAVEPSSQFVLGGTVPVVRASLTNDSPAVAAAIQLRAQVRAEGEASALIEQVWNFDLGPGATAERTLTLTALPQQVQAWSVQLQARLPADPPGVWRTLDTRGINGVDGIGPQITIVAPDRTAPHRSPATLAARITDAHSRVEQAWYRIDGGSWRSLSSGGVAGYEALLHGLADGEHELELRAQDLWGNEALLSGHRFDADSTAPVIVIDGVVDGGVGNQPVQASITVQDAHPDITQSWLDGVPYASGSGIAAEGVHQLRVRATDRAGNRSERVLSFTLDFTAPAVSIIAPADGTRTSNDSIDVRLASEPGAQLQLNVGAYQTQAPVGPGRVVDFVAVPLQVGDNLLRAIATDAAQNVSTPVMSTVVREPLSGVLGGQIVPALSELPRGQDLALQLLVDNGTAQEIDPLLLRLRAFDAGSTLLFEEIIPTALASGAQFQADRSLVAADWDFGPVQLVLDADRGEGYQTLTTTTITVVDAQAPVITPLAPLVGSIQPRPTQLAASIIDDRAVQQAEYRIDTGPWIALDALAADSFGASVPLADGAHDVQYRAADAADNIALSAVIGFVVDGTPPQITVSGIADGEIFNHAVAAEVHVLDAHPADLQLLLNGAPYVSGSMIEDSGLYLLALEATDAAGNQSQRSLQFEIDLEAPDVVFVVPLADAIIAKSGVLVIGNTEPGASVRLIVDDFEAVVQASAKGVFNIPDVPLQPGENLLRARATDRAGNAGVERSRRVFHAPGNPTGLEGTLVAVPHSVAAGTVMDLRFTISEQAGAVRAGLPLRIELQAVGAADPVVSRTRVIDLGAAQSFSDSEFVSSTGLALGDYVANFDVQLDGAWHALASDVLEIVDRTAPEVTLLSPLPDSVHRTMAPVRALASDDNGIERVEARIEGGSWFAMSEVAVQWQVDLALPQEGELVLEVRAHDVHANVSKPVQVGIRSDQSAPVISISGLSDGQSSRGPVVPVVSIIDASAYDSELTLDGVAFVSGTPVTAEGDHLLEVSATDIVGNHSARSVAFSIDQTAPGVIFVQPQDGAHVSADRIDVLGRTEPAAQVLVVQGAEQRSTTADAAGNFAVSGLPLRDGDNRIAARATDQAGNVGEWSEIGVLRACGTPDLGCSLFADGFESGLRAQLDAPNAQTDGAKGIGPMRSPALIPAVRIELAVLAILAMLVTAFLQLGMRSGRP